MEAHQAHLYWPQPAAVTKHQNSPRKQPEVSGGFRRGSVSEEAWRQLPFSGLLRYLRLSRGLRQVDLGMRCHMDASMISRLERGSHAPDATDVDRLADGLQLSTGEHDALRLAYERDVLRRKALSSDTLISSTDTLRLAQEQVAVARRLRLAGRSEVAAASAAQTAQWVGMMARAAGSAPAQKALLESLMDLLSEQFRGNLEHLLGSYGGSSAAPRQRWPAAEPDADLARLMELWAVSRQAMEIGEELEEIPAWLMEAASDVAELGLWAALEPEAAGAGVVGSRVSSLRLGLRDVRLRRQGALADSLAALSVGLQGESLPGRADDFLALHRANALRTLGRYRDAAAVYEQLALGGAGNSGRERYWAADRAYLDGSFQAALESLSEVESGGHLRGDALLLAGHVHRVNALFGSALAAYRRALELARQTGSPSMEARALTGVAQTLSWTHPKKALKWTRRALISNRVLGNQVEVVKAHLALAVAATGARAWEEAGSEIEAARALAEAVGYQEALVTADIAEAFQALVAGRTAAAGRLYRQVEEATTRLGGKAFWLDVLDAWMGASAGRRATWLGGPQATSIRWARVLQRRQARSLSPLQEGSGTGN